jgi:hypothetical protein
MTVKQIKYSLSLFILVVSLFLHNVNTGGGASLPIDATVCLLVGLNASPPERSDDALSQLYKFNAVYAFHFFIHSMPNHFTAASGQVSRAEYNPHVRSISLLISQTIFKKNISHLSSRGDSELPSFI